MKTEGSVEIKRGIEEVFELTNNHVAEWSSIVVSERVVRETPEVVGSAFHLVTSENDQQLEFYGVVTHYDPPHASAILLTGKLFNIDVAYRFEEYNGRTTVTQLSIVSGKGAMKLVLFLMSLFMKRASQQSLAKELNNLKHFCENYQQSIQIPD